MGFDVFGLDTVTEYCHSQLGGSLFHVNPEFLVMQVMHVVYYGELERTKEHTRERYGVDPLITNHHHVGFSVLPPQNWLKGSLSSRRRER